MTVLQTTSPFPAAVERGPGAEGAIALEANALRVVARRSRRARDITILHDITFAVAPGELLAIVGGSGAGKSTLLNVLAGVRQPTSGAVTYNGTSLAGNVDRLRGILGYVPQDDIVHRELTVQRTLEYAALLRLPTSLDRFERLEAVETAMARLDLQAQSRQKVGSLSGGQRKRVSIGAELLTNPGLFFLDEPTSGLDPATGRDMMRTLRRLADSGSTIVLTTHAPQDIAACDRVIFLARGGYLAFIGTPLEALQYFRVESMDAIYECLATEKEPREWAAAFADYREGLFEPPTPVPEALPVPREGGGAVHQLKVLTRRNSELITQSPLTLAILAGAPLMIIAMFAILFQPGAFDFDDPGPSASIQTLFWLAFGAFFFGVTYGLQQICTEFPVFFRERLVNVRVLPYVLSKMLVLLPVITVVVALMLFVMWALNRLPSGGLDVYGVMFVTLLLSGIAAIAMGLLGSAAVSKPDQAILILPLLCFPQVLFAGAMLPFPLMAPVGQAIGYLMGSKYTFEALGKTVDLEHILGEGGSPLGPPLLAQYEDSFSNPEWQAWLILAGFTVVLLAATCLVLKRKATSFS